MFYVDNDKKPLQKYVLIEYNLQYNERITKTTKIQRSDIINILKDVKLINALGTIISKFRIDGILLKSNSNIVKNLQVTRSFVSPEKLSSFDQYVNVAVELTALNQKTDVRLCFRILSCLLHQ